LGVERRKIWWSRTIRGSPAPVEGGRGALDWAKTVLTEVPRCLGKA